jgi:hypothetical protein
MQPVSGHDLETLKFSHRNVVIMLLINITWALQPIDNGLPDINPKGNATGVELCSNGAMLKNKF